MLTQNEAPVLRRRFGAWSRTELSTGPRLTLPPLPSLAVPDSTVSTDPCQRMLAAIQAAGGALMILNGSFEAWVVLLKDGTPLRFTHATGNRLVVLRQIKRHPRDCREMPVDRFIPAGEAPPTYVEIDRDILTETALQLRCERHRMEKTKARLAEGRARFQRKRPGLNNKALTEAEAAKSRADWTRSRRGAKRQEEATPINPHPAEKVADCQIGELPAGDAELAAIYIAARDAWRAGSAQPRRASC